jgi:hypothetical protein
MNSTGNTPQYIRHTFEVVKVVKSYSIYQICEVTGTKNLLTDLLRIEKYFGKSNAQNIDHYLRLRTTTNWSTSQMITGLRPTSKKVLFYGDWFQTDQLNNRKKTLLLFTFSNDGQTLFIDVYRGFYPNHKGILQNIINTYETN